MSPDDDARERTYLAQVRTLLASSVVLLFSLRVISPGAGGPGAVVVGLAVASTLVLLPLAWRSLGGTSNGRAAPLLHLICIGVVLLDAALAVASALDTALGTPPGGTT